MAYPVLISSLDAFPKRQQRLRDAIATAEAAHAAGVIPNVQYQTVKSTINGALYEATSVGDNVTGWTGERWNYSHPQLHTIAGYAKKLRANDNDKVKAFIREIAPLGELFAALKDMVSKRQPKTTSDDPRDPRYVPPTVTSAAAQRVHTLLTDMMAENFDALVQAMVRGMEGQIARFKKAQEEAAQQGKTLSLRAYGKLRSTDINFLSHVTHDNRPTSMAVVMNDDAAQTILRLATKDAEEIRAQFVAKNLRKIVSIVETKEAAGAALTELAVIAKHIAIGGLTGDFRARFSDGSGFDFTNAVVWVMNAQGTQFNRFPLTFHNVKLAGGVKMPRPSEERMNTVFVAG